MSTTPAATMEVTLTVYQRALLAEFQRSEKLALPAQALALLIEIAFEVVTGTGDRFWDKSAPAPGNEPPRRVSQSGGDGKD